MGKISNQIDWQERYFQPLASCFKSWYILSRSGWVAGIWVRQCAVYGHLAMSQPGLDLPANSDAFLWVAMVALVDLVALLLIQ